MGGPSGDETSSAAELAAPTELAGAAEAETQSAYAWGLVDEDYDEEPRRLTPGRITALAVAGSAVLIAVAAVIGYANLQRRGAEPAPAAAAESTISTVSAAPAPPSAAPPTSAAPQPSRPAAPTTLPAAGGRVFVGSKSGKTSCEVTAGGVNCLVKFVIDTPMRYGTPANGVYVTIGGDFEWGIGDTGQQRYKPLDYGVVYRTLGWTITPTTEGTTFINDTTGHGMTVSVEGVSPF